MRHKGNSLSVGNTTSLEKNLSNFDLFTTGFGAIIGVGWVIVIGEWINKGSGPLSTAAAFLFGALLLIPIAMIFGELSVAMPVAGGAIVYTLKAFGKKTSFFTGWFLTLAYIMLCPWEVIAIGQLIETLFPSIKTIPLYTIGQHTIYFPTLIICVIVALLIFYINNVGIKKAAQVQNILVIILFSMSIIIIIFSLIYGKIENILPVSAPTPMNPSGSLVFGFLSIVAISPFFYSGFDTIGQEAEEVGENTNKKRAGSIPYKAIICAAVFYALIIIAISTIIPWQQLLELNLPAAEAFSIGLGMDFMKVMVILGAMCGIITTLNSFFVAGARVLLSMGRAKMIPTAFSKVHKKHKTPVTANTFIVIISIIGSFLGKSLILPIINVCSFGFMLAWFMVGVSALKIKKDYPDLIRGWQKMKYENRLPVRVRLYLTHPNLIDIDEFLKLGFGKDFGDEWISIGGIKLFVDGVMSHANGFMMDDLKWSQGELNDLVAKANDAGFQLWLHTLSPAAIKCAVEAFEYALGITPRVDHRHRIEHCADRWNRILDGKPFVSRELKEKIKRLGLIPVSTPQHISAFPDRPGVPTRTLINEGYITPGASDTTGAQPESCNPWYGIGCLVSRKNLYGKVLTPEECITPIEAIRMNTLWGAYCGFEEKIKGSLEPGKLADFCILVQENP
jgi:APA family basic amino acid/polyamine antiporter